MAARFELRQAGRRWRAEAHARLSGAREVVRLLMKPRNGAPWSTDERDRLRQELRALARVAPIFVLVVLPGGKLLLPVYAWLLDRRRDAAALPSGLEADRRATPAAEADALQSEPPAG
jgi:hypothetical protein